MALTSGAASVSFFMSAAAATVTWVMSKYSLTVPVTST